MPPVFVGRNKENKQMRTIMMTAVLMVMTGCATAGSSVKLHDPEVTQSLEAFMREGFDAMNKNDMAFWAWYNLGRVGK